MGYPMTFQRFLNRNQLAQQSEPMAWAAGCNMSPSVDGEPSIGAVRREHLRRFEDSARRMREDLARLTRDTLDERVLCVTIAVATGIDADVVAAVLKAYLQT